MLKGVKVLFSAGIALLYALKKPLMEADDFCKITRVKVKFRNCFFIVGLNIKDRNRCSKTLIANEA